MNMDSIGALLEALKRSEGKSGLGMDDDEDAKPIAAKLSVIKAKPISSDPDADADTDLGDDMGDMSAMDSDESADEDSSQDDARNAAIVDVLQSDYPQIYDKIDKQLGKSDSGDLSDTTDASSMMS